MNAHSKENLAQVEVYGVLLPLIVQWRVEVSMLKVASDRSSLAESHLIQFSISKSIVIKAHVNLIQLNLISLIQFKI